MFKLDLATAKIFLLSLLRALIQAFPLGSSGDQAIFGTWDMLATQFNTHKLREIRVVLNCILGSLTLEQVLESERFEELVSHNRIIQNALTKLIECSESEVQKLLEIFTIILQNSVALIDINSKLIALDQKIDAMRNHLMEITRIQFLDSCDIDNELMTLQDLTSSLHLDSVVVDNEIKNTIIKQVFNKLSNFFNVCDILTTSVEYIFHRDKIVNTIDFSEIHAALLYSVTDDIIMTYSSYYMLKEHAFNIHVLPSTLAEMSKFISSMSRYDELLIQYHYSNPIKRITEMIYNKTLSVIDHEIFTNDEWRRIVKLAQHELTTQRPETPINNLRDAENIAFLLMHNAKYNNDCKKKYAIHITRSSLFHRAVNNIHQLLREESRYQYSHEIQEVIKPTVIAFANVILKEEGIGGAENLREILYHLHIDKYLFNTVKIMKQEDISRFRRYAQIIRRFMVLIYDKVYDETFSDIHEIRNKYSYDTNRSISDLTQVIIDFMMLEKVLTARFYIQQLHDNL